MGCVDSGVDSGRRHVFLHFPSQVVPKHLFQNFRSNNDRLIALRKYFNRWATTLFQGEMRSDRRWRESLNSMMMDEGRKGEGGGKSNENTLLD